MSIYNGYPTPGRDEDGDQWEDSDDGDMPWEPNPVEKPQPWEAAQWGGTPEERMWRELMDEDDQGDS